MELVRVSNLSSISTMRACSSEGGTGIGNFKNIGRRSEVTDELTDAF